MIVLALTHALAASAGALTLYAFVQPKLARLAKLTDRDPKTGRFI